MRGELPFIVAGGRGGVTRGPGEGVRCGCDLRSCCLVTTGFLGDGVTAGGLGFTFSFLPGTTGDGGARFGTTGGETFPFFVGDGTC